MMSRDDLSHSNCDLCDLSGAAGATPGEDLFTLIAFDKPIVFSKKPTSGPVLGRVQLLIKFEAYFNNPSHESPVGHNS